MIQYINKDKAIELIEKAVDEPAPSHDQQCPWEDGYYCGLYKAEVIIENLEVVDPYEQWCQHDSIKSGIQAHADIYSFNIESELFNQLTKEQQKLWRKEIEQACISGGEAGVNLAKDPRYKENLEVKEVDLEKEIELVKGDYEQVDVAWNNDFDFIAKHFFELGLNASNKTQKGE